MSARKYGKVLVFASGEKIPVLSEDGKFFYFEGRQFRKGNPEITEVRKIPADRKEKKDAQ